MAFQQKKGLQTDDQQEEIQLDDYMIAIIHYIRDNSGKNANDITNAMDKKTCSRITTLKKIRYLLKLGIIEDRKEGNGFHEYHLSDKSEFNRIEQILDRISLLDNKLEQPLFNKREFNTSEQICDLMSFLDNKLDQPLFDEILEETVDEYPAHIFDLKNEFWDSINDIILFLLTLANNEKLSKYDSTILTRKIIELSLKIGLLYHDPTKKMRGQLRSINEKIKYYDDSITKKNNLVATLQQQEGQTEFEKEQTLRLFKKQELETKQLNELKHIFDDLKLIVESLQINSEN